MNTELLSTQTEGIRMKVGGGGAFQYNYHNSLPMVNLMHFELLTAKRKPALTHIPFIKWFNGS